MVIIAYALVSGRSSIAQTTTPLSGTETAPTRSNSQENRNEPFFAERYLTVDQRLAKRQERILQVLKSPDPLNTAALKR